MIYFCPCVTVLTRACIYFLSGPSCWAIIDLLRDLIMSPYPWLVNDMNIQILSRFLVSTSLIPAFLTRVSPLFWPHWLVCLWQTQWRDFLIVLHCASLQGLGGHTQALCLDLYRGPRRLLSHDSKFSLVVLVIGWIGLKYFNKLFLWSFCNL